MMSRPQLIKLLEQEYSYKAILIIEVVGHCFLGIAFLKLIIIISLRHYTKSSKLHPTTTKSHLQSISKPLSE